MAVNRMPINDFVADVTVRGLVYVGGFINLTDCNAPMVCVFSATREVI